MCIKIRRPIIILTYVEKTFVIVDCYLLLDYRELNMEKIV